LTEEQRKEEFPTELHRLWPRIQLNGLNLAMVKSPAGKAEQVEKARNAMHKWGFFYVVNHGLDRAQVCQSRNCGGSLTALLLGEKDF
jgi:isopenicillin N synthase-like dioxygenase